MRIFSSDCCDCEIEISPNWDWLSSVKKCKLHKALPDNSSHLIVVLAHIRSFNFKFGIRNITELEEDEISSDKANEKQRISDL